MASIQRKAKVAFAKALNHVGVDFFDNMEKQGLSEFGKTLFEDRGFDRALAKAQMKFNDMVDEYLIEDTRNIDVDFRVEEGNMKYGNVGGHGFDYNTVTEEVVIVDSLGKPKKNQEAFAEYAHNVRRAASEM